jgi:hypothetical protein
MQSLLPSEQMLPAPQTASMADLLTLLALMREDKAEMKAEMKQQNDELKAELEKLREEGRPRTAQETISEERLELLQTRLHALSSARLLTDDQLNTAEDIVADCIEAMAKIPKVPITVHAVDQTLTMVVLSERLAVDSVLARQLRRKLNI